MREENGGRERLDGEEPRREVGDHLLLRLGGESHNGLLGQKEEKQMRTKTYLEETIAVVGVSSIDEGGVVEEIAEAAKGSDGKFAGVKMRRRKAGQAYTSEEASNPSRDWDERSEESQGKQRLRRRVMDSAASLGT